MAERTWPQYNVQSKLHTVWSLDGPDQNTDFTESSAGGAPLGNFPGWHWAKKGWTE